MREDGEHLASGEERAKGGGATKTNEEEQFAEDDTQLAALRLGGEPGVRDAVNGNRDQAEDGRTTSGQRDADEDLVVTKDARVQRLFFRTKQIRDQAIDPGVHKNDILHEHGFGSIGKQSGDRCQVRCHEGENRIVTEFADAFWVYGLETRVFHEEKLRVSLSKDAVRDPLCIINAV